MSEKTEQAIERQLAKKERFEFVLTINDNIICQRYFHINGFKPKSLYSQELKETFNYCVSLIKRDLRNKSAIFLKMTVPQIFESKEQMDEWVKHPSWELEVPSFIVLKDSDEVYVWDGEKVDLYDGFFNRSEFLVEDDDETNAKNDLKLAFLDNGKEIISQVWDGNVYPRFVRNNIDLSNQKNRYDGNSICESILIKAMIDGQKDLIPQIVKELCVCCSYEEGYDYTTRVNYGGKTYGFSPNSDWTKYVNSLESFYRKKTEDYRKTLY